MFGNCREQTLSEVYEGLLDYEREKIHELIGTILDRDFALLYSTLSDNEKTLVKFLVNEAVYTLGEI